MDITTKNRETDKFECLGCGKIGLITSYVTHGDMLMCPRCLGKDIVRVTSKAGTAGAFRPQARAK